MRGGITLGDNFYCNANCIINASKEIIIGNDFLMGWNGTIIDGDGHNMFHDNQPVERSQEIHIGSHVWCAGNVSILKGSVLPDDTVVAYNGVITKKFSQKNTLVGGVNKRLAENVNWNK